MIHQLIFMTLVFASRSTGSAFTQKKQANHPPWIIQHPPFEKAYKLGERAELRCKADGTPAPTYSWLKNGEPLVRTGLEIQQLPNEGTLVFNDPKPSHEGIYQCFASNSLGTAATVKTILKKAVLEPFPTIKQPYVHPIPVGSSLILPCQPPYSYPSALIYWGENRNSSKLRAIDNTARVSQDYAGNLYFANVAMEDSLNGHAYICLVENKELRSLVQGDDQKIEPTPSKGTPRYEPPRSLWTSPGRDIAVRGQTKRMKCIFAGYPTPKVSWVRLDTTLPSKVEMASFGQELVIPDVDFSDAGQYQCLATNIADEEPERKLFTLDVDSHPFWRNKPPEDVNTSEEENAVFECIVNGHPKPKITWYINGVLEEDSLRNVRRTVGPGWLKYDNVTKSDAQVIQCNASNAHGYIFANAYLNVLAEAPTFLEAPQKELKVAEGQKAVLKCHVVGAPKPTLYWQKGDNLDDISYMDREHFKILDNGNLEIINVRKEDQDMYQCYAFNKFGAEAAHGNLLVVERTVIVEPPKDQVVEAGDRVSFKCNATTDPNELMHLKMEWKKDDEVLIFDGADADRWSLVDDGRLLTIKRVRVDDSGSYTCTASNGLDLDVATAALTVRGHPSPPYDVRITSCRKNYTDISWMPGNDNNDPVKYYTVFFNTSHDEVGKFQEAIRVNSTRNGARIFLQPWTSYSFHVRAENGVGLSNRSEFSESACTTLETIPYRNPNRVCTESRDPNSLVIIWEPMLRTEHNGEGFHYLISYRRHDLPDAEEIQYKEYDWRQSELQVSHQEMYKPYEISVQAVNSLGSAPDEPEKKLGFSGQDVPQVIPEDFQLVLDLVNSTNAVFRWRPVDPDPSVVRGFFKGYQLRFWKVEDETNVRTENITIHQWQPCVPLPGGKPRAVRSSSELIEASTSKLWPFSMITAGVLVLNGAKSGRLSETVTFKTPEGVPSAVPVFWVSERGSHHLRLSWTAPFEVNGILKGYQLKYNKAPQTTDEWIMVYVEDPLQTSKKIQKLDSDTLYTVSIVAVTGAGTGREMTIEEATVSIGVPDVPSIESLVSGHDHVNVSWLPSGKETPKNPGCQFIVRYRQADETDWKETQSEDEHNWFNVTDLENGKKYEFTVVALNRDGDRMISDQKDIVVGIFPETLVHHATSTTWLIVLICLLLLILLVLLIIFLIRRNRGGKYPVYEKEKLHGNKGKLDEEPTFGEYVRTEESMIKKSQGSLESSSKSEEENSDSLGAYEDVDPTKFNDEGSFVDQAGYKKPLVTDAAKPLADLTSPSALTTFV